VTVGSPLVAGQQLGPNRVMGGHVVNASGTSLVPRIAAKLLQSEMFCPVLCWRQSRFRPQGANELHAQADALHVAMAG
jgi:hypothetical protein